MYKRKAVVRAEKGQLKGISESITGDYEAGNQEFYYSFEFDGDKLTVYCTGETYLKPKIDEFCNWIEEHYNER